MSKKEFLLDQLEVCRNVESWIQPLSVALDNLSLENISWRKKFLLIRSVKSYTIYISIMKDG